MNHKIVALGRKESLLVLSPIEIYIEFITLQRNGVTCNNQLIIHKSVHYKIQLIEIKSMYFADRQQTCMLVATY